MDGEVVFGCYGVRAFGCGVAHASATLPDVHGGTVTMGFRIILYVTIVGLCCSCSTTVYSCKSKCTVSVTGLCCVQVQVRCESRPV